MEKKGLILFWVILMCGNWCAAQEQSTAPLLASSAENRPAKEKVPPVFPGGETALAKYLKVQHPCKTNCCSAFDRNPTVELSLNANGVVQKVKIAITSACPVLDTIAYRHIAAMPDWQPATIDGKPVPYTIKLEISFNRSVETVNAAMGYVYPFKNGIAPINPFNQPKEEVSIPTVGEVYPEFPGGSSAMLNYLIKMPYNPETKSGNLEVKIGFSIEPDGSLSEVVVVQSSGNETFDSLAVEHIKKMPKWRPGYKDGIPVRVNYVIPLKHSW